MSHETRPTKRNWEEGRVLLLRPGDRKNRSLPRWETFIGGGGGGDNGEEQKNLFLRKRIIKRRLFRERTPSDDFISEW